MIRARLGGPRLVVASERSHRVAEHAQPFLQLRPGTLDRLYAAMAKVTVDRGLDDRTFVAHRCQGALAFLSAMREVDLIAAAAACGREAARIEEADGLRAGPRRRHPLLHRTPRRPEVAEALVNLALLTGNVGRVGGGVYPLAEHNNLQGVCDVGMLPGLLPGYRPAHSDEVRTELSRRWGSSPEIAGVRGRVVLLRDGVTLEIFGVKTFRWHLEDPTDQEAFRRYRTGQFAQVSVFGAGECPLSLPASPEEEELLFTVRQVGSCSAAGCG